MSKPVDEQPSAEAMALWRDLCEKDDRTSPEEYPDMALITADEFCQTLDAFAAQAVARAYRKGRDDARTEGWCPWHAGYHRNYLCEHGYGASAMPNQIEEAIARERERCRLAAISAQLPSHYQWGHDAMEQFNFGKERAAQAIEEGRPKP